MTECTNCTALNGQLTTVNQDYEASKEQVAKSREEITALNEKVNNLTHLINESNANLLAAQAEAASLQEKLNEANRNYKELSNASGIESLRSLITELSSEQIDDLNKHTNFRTDTIELAHTQKQIQGSSLFVQSTFEELKTSVDSIIGLQTNTLTRRIQGKDIATKALTSAGTPKAVVNISITPVESDIKQIEADIEGWKRFSALLIDAVNQSNSTKIENEETSTPFDEAAVPNSG